VAEFWHPTGTSLTIGRSPCAIPAITTDPTTVPAGGEHDPYPATDPTRRDDGAYHLARVCARFPRTISTAARTVSGTLRRGWASIIASGAPGWCCAKVDHGFGS
jgi:hypothetical protein